MSGLARRKILVTGATGFIGSRIVATLAAHEGAHVRVLVRDLSKASYISRYSVDIVNGDLRDVNTAAQAVKDCDVVIHCAYGSGGDNEAKRAVTVDGTRTLLEQATAAKVRRVVHFGTVSVYPNVTSGTLDESSVREYSGALYGDTKLESEEVALGFWHAHQLPVVVLQPTVVYGPFCAPWAVKPLEQLSTGRVIAVNGGTGVCNAVFVDDVVHATIRAATTDAGAGERFLISGPDQCTWLEFYDRYQTMLGLSDRLTPMSLDQVERHWADTRPRVRTLAGELRLFAADVPTRDRLLRTKEMQAVLRTGRRWLSPAMWRRLKQRAPAATPSQNGAGTSRLPLHPLDPVKAQFMASTAVVSTQKAQSVLGYSPTFTVARGMAITEAWARWARYVQTPN